MGLKGGDFAKISRLPRTTFLPKAVCIEKYQGYWLFDAKLTVADWFSP